jgi:CBS domain-containing protein
MRVKELMTTTVATCRSEDTLARAAQILFEKDCGCIPVVDQRANVVGIVTDRDALLTCYTQGKLLPEIPVAAAMTRSVICCRPDDSVAAAERLMATNRIRRLPVTNELGRLVGILAIDDIAREAARERWQRAKEVSDTEVGETLAAVCRHRQEVSAH